MKKLSFLLLSFVFLTISCHKKPKEEDTSLNYTKYTTAYKTVQGVDADLLSLDVYYDADDTDAKPVLIWVHGGGWSIGDKSYQMDNKKKLFASLGYILVSVNYRLSPFPYEVNNPNRIKFPTHNIDIADAIKWVYDHISTYGGNPDKIILLGHSAGAHLVSLTATNQSYLQQAGVPVTSIVGVASIDTKMYDVYDQIQNQANVPDMYLNAFGNDPQENTEASPIRNLSATYFPKFFIAKRGSADRIQAANQFILALQNAGVDEVTLYADSYNHIQINDAIGEKDEDVITPALKSFFKSCL